MVGWCRKELVYLGHFALKTSWRTLKGFSCLAPSESICSDSSGPECVTEPYLAEGEVDSTNREKRVKTT